MGGQRNNNKFLSISRSKIDVYEESILNPEINGNIFLRNYIY
jgi:hypothetical protein